MTRLDSFYTYILFSHFGAQGRTRTGTRVISTDFKSVASTNSATRAKMEARIGIEPTYTALQSVTSFQSSSKPKLVKGMPLLLLRTYLQRDLYTSFLFVSIFVSQNIF